MLMKRDIQGSRIINSPSITSHASSLLPLKKSCTPSLNLQHPCYKGEEPYAVAINVPKNQCQGNFDPLNEYFLPLKTNATYKFTIFLSRLLLLFLLPDWTESVENNTVDVNTLARIINFFEKNYKRVDGDGHHRQYAVAISVPKHQCQPNFSPSNNSFLTQENATNVKNAIANETNALYQGAELIAAGTRKVVISKKQQHNMHSESLLLNPADNSPMTKLLNKTKGGCSVFYTFDSPCVNTCLNATGNHSVIKALENWKKHAGIKAFVFKNFWKFDTHKKNLQNEFKQIAAHVPLFRCVSETQCYACKGEGNTPINAQCLPNQN
ncbi:hypothetical protein QQF64_009026 [Cirrhinus molitorella]|uniref:Uncharacterized protein n=1 Tax=Cirrhinus molitorella TaxID=172907 RepID=A0ABR3M7X0_9TELE